MTTEWIKNTNDILSHLSASKNNPRALNYQKDDQWHSVSTEEILEQVKLISLGLTKLGVKKGDKVGLMAPSSPFWTMIDLGIMSLGAVCVPLFVNISEDNFIFEVTQTGLKVLFVSSDEALELYEKHRNLFQKVILLEGSLSKTECEISYTKLLEEGRNLESASPNLYTDLLNQIANDDLATIIYTSGSTGIPKGAEIEQKALVSLAHFDGFKLDGDNERYLSILPLAHVFARVTNLWLIHWGVCIYYLNDPKKIAFECQAIHPTILIVVPRLLEKIYSKLTNRVQQAGYMKRAIGLWAFDLAHDDDDSLLKVLLHPIADKIVYSALREAFGGSIRIVISGGAPLNPQLCHFFIDIGIPIYQGWGMTESATVTVNLPIENKIGTVGKPLSGMQVKIAEDGEVLVKGPNVMRGYYQNSEANAKVFDKDGWLKTGDKGSLDAEGYLTLQGRLKEMFKTSTGEYVVPTPIEQALCKAPLIDMAMVIAEGRKFTSCLLFPDLDVVHALKESKQEGHLSDEEFLNSSFIKNEMKKLVEDVNTHLNHWEQIQEYRFIPVQLSAESGGLTPSMKIRREFVSEKYKDVIASIYPEEDI